MQTRAEEEKAHRDIIKAFKIFMMLTLLGACTLKGIFLAHGPWFINHTLDDYFHLNAEETAYLETRVPLHWHWLLVEKGDEIVSDIRTFKDMIARGFIPADVITLRGKMLKWRKVLAERLGDDATKILAGLSPEQVGALKEKLDEADEKWEKMLADTKDEDFREDLLDEHADNFKRWYGSITAEQRESLGKILPMSRDYANELLEQSQGSRLEFIKLLTPPKTAASVGKGLTTFVLTPQEFRPVALRNRHAKMTEDFWNTILLRDSVAIPSQRAFAAEKVQSFIDAFHSAMADELNPK
jgi:hypothetical protein